MCFTSIKVVLMLLIVTLTFQPSHGRPVTRDPLEEAFNVLEAAKDTAEGLTPQQISEDTRDPLEEAFNVLKAARDTAEGLTPQQVSEDAKMNLEDLLRTLADANIDIRHGFRTPEETEELQKVPHPPLADLLRSIAQNYHQKVGKKSRNIRGSQYRAELKPAANAAVHDVYGRGETSSEAPGNPKMKSKGSRFFSKAKDFISGKVEPKEEESFELFVPHFKPPVETVTSETDVLIAAVDAMEERLGLQLESSKSIAYSILVALILTIIILVIIIFCIHRKKNNKDIQPDIEKGEMSDILEEEESNILEEEEESNVLEEEKSDVQVSISSSSDEYFTAEDFDSDHNPSS